MTQWRGNVEAGVSAWLGDSERSESHAWGESGAGPGGSGPR